ncbi:MAG: DNA cytosine methyltransferase [Candidatus Cryptobacteroides sp.]
MRVVSFFAGCGGLDLGFEQSGFDVVWANEFNPCCQATYIRNHPDTTLVIGDVCQIDPADIPDCDGFIGGPPCQSWSVGGRQRGLNDERGMLFVKYLELINAKKPKFFLIENVKGMLDDKFKDIFNGFVHRLDSYGYDVRWTLLDAADFGVPQNRERVFFIGFRKELGIEYNFPEPNCLQPVTLQEAIGDITESPACFNVVDKVEKGHYLNHDVLTSEFGLFYYRGNRRRGWHQPSFTINATAEFAPLHPSSPKMLYYGHENWRFQNERLGEYRRLSVRECARIQSFPDSFIFEYNDIREAYRMIGNAVPPLLAKTIAKSVADSIFSLKVESNASARNTNISGTVLVGYYKGDKHLQCILRNRMYYVRSGGRKGSLFKEDCSIMPDYLLLHHENEAELYELEVDEPMLVDAGYLKKLGFDVRGNKYLCFRIRNVEPQSDFVLGLRKGFVDDLPWGVSPFLLQLMT